MEYLILIPVVAATAALWALVNRDRRGPGRCIGCGKCDKTGICILPGKPLGGGKKKAE